MKSVYKSLANLFAANSESPEVTRLGISLYSVSDISVQDFFILYSAHIPYSVSALQTTQDGYDGGGFNLGHLSLNW